jgi:hypothetical protein
MRKQAMRFLVELSMDPLKRESFQRDPQSVLESAGITDEEARAVLGGGDPIRIGSYVASTEGEEPPPVLVLVMK